jgi:5-methylcytosine-specific restriction protein A
MAWSTSRHRGSTRQSRRTRAIILATWPTCHLRYPGCTTLSTEDDHVIPLTQGGTDNPANRRGACRNCHTIKTRREAQTGKTRRNRNRTEQHPGLL